MTIVSGDPRTITRLLIAWGEGDAEALEELTPLVYRELEGLAGGYLRRERSSHTLQPGALVHEAFLRLLDQRQLSWQNRSHFFGIAAQMMRRALIDHARGRRYARRGRGALHVTLEEASELALPRAPEVLAVDEALTDLGREHPQVARIVELRFFAGLTQTEIAGLLSISVPTVKRHWRLARAWLHRYFQQAGMPEEEAEE